MRALLCAALLLVVACRTADPEPIYRPTENVLEAVAVLRLHIDDDTYRFWPARDFAGKNIYRASLNRLEALEAIHADKFKSGYLLDVILFSKGRALERITDFDLAAHHYARVAEMESVLARPAARSSEICDTFAAARQLRPPPGAPVEEAMKTFDDRQQMLHAMDLDGTHYEAVRNEELEQTDLTRARYFRARAELDPSLNALVLQQYQRLTSQNQQSKLRNRHLLELADLYADLSRDYVASNAPVSLDFDPATFDEYSYAATRLYETVSQQDGAVEKIEAARKLEAYLAFTLQVYDEKVEH